MPADKLFWNDPYLTEMTAVITGVQDAVVTLDRTIFYAASGGQESDTGTIGGFPVLNAGKKDLEIFYTLEGAHGLKKGDEVSVRIDWPRRYRLMRLHFAAEIILELVYRHLGGPAKIGAHISEDKARVDFLFDHRISDGFPLLLQEAGKIIDGNMPIISAYSDRETERRYWEINGFARVSCGGTHLRYTGEVGGITLKRNNIGKGKERIEIYVD